jgi:peptidoglycan/xylan/chitin deacetylase (PgdA/CDA1 family)
MAGLSIALKVDCDTAEGTRTGIPRLLGLFEELQIRASFFFSLGPDRSGRAVVRFFTKKGFLKKMLRSRAPSLYGWRTILSGTLLPAQEIRRAGRTEILSVAAAGHETGVHAWDHVSWQDHVGSWSSERTAKEYAELHAAYREIFGEPARASAAPGWAVSDAYLSIRESWPLSYTSDTRGGRPFFPQLEAGPSKILEIPTTLPTLDELLGDPRFRDAGERLAYCAALPEQGRFSVHTIHTEVEGGPHRDWFRELLKAWKSAGATFLTLGEAGREALLQREGIPCRRIGNVSLSGRAGRVASGWTGQ